MAQCVDRRAIHAQRENRMERSAIRGILLLRKWRVLLAQSLLIDQIDDIDLGKDANQAIIIFNHHNIVLDQSRHNFL